MISFEAYMPDTNTMPRADSGLETSVNWDDGPEVRDRTLRDRSVAEHGAARFELEEVDRIAQGPNVLGKLLAERREVDGNPHHGNIVFIELPKATRKMIANALALRSKFIPRSRPGSSE